MSDELTKRLIDAVFPRGDRVVKVQRRGVGDEYPKSVHRTSHGQREKLPPKSAAVHARLIFELDGHRPSRVKPVWRVQLENVRQNVRSANADDERFSGQLLKSKLLNQLWQILDR